MIYLLKVYYNILINACRNVNYHKKVIKKLKIVILKIQIF